MRLWASTRWIATSQAFPASFTAKSEGFWGCFLVRLILRMVYHPLPPEQPSPHHDQADHDGQAQARPEDLPGATLALSAFSVLDIAYRPGVGLVGVVNHVNLTQLHGTLTISYTVSLCSLESTSPPGGGSSVRPWLDSERYRLPCRSEWSPTGFLSATPRRNFP